MIQTILIKHRINELKIYLLTRGYNNNFLEGQFLCAASISRTNALLSLKILTMLYHLLSHITKQFHAFLISYTNILTSYTPLTVAKTSLSNRLLLLTDVDLIFVTFSRYKRLSKKSFVRFLYSAGRVANLSLAWPLCGLKSSLRSVRNS